MATGRTFLCLALSSLETEAFSFMADRRILRPGGGDRRDSGSGSLSRPLSSLFLPRRGGGGEERCAEEREGSVRLLPA